MSGIPFDNKEARQKVALQETAWGTFAHYIPVKPQDVLVLGHCYPWLDGSRTAAQLGAHVQAYAERWRAFADAHHLILLVPAFGSGDFLGYRALVGTRIAADVFVNTLVDTYGRKLINAFDGKCYLYGHSAGGQFANRYSVVHPHRLKGVVLSAPGRYAYPDPAIPWPYGMGASEHAPQDNRRWKVHENLGHVRNQSYHPEPQGWIIAATKVPIAIVIGSEDTAGCLPQPGHEAGTRIDYAKKWMQMMNALAEIHGTAGTVSLTIVEGVAHDPVRLTATAQAVLLTR
jgi:hypothetical protein